jgi:cell wall-associated NlpC family hydrolase
MERGTQVVWGESHAVPWEAQALFALARQLTPSAHERDAAPVRLSRYLLPACVAAACAAVPSVAAASGGAGLGGGDGTTTTTAPTTTTPTVTTPTTTAAPVGNTGTLTNGGAGLGASPALHPMVAGTTAAIVNGVAFAPADAPPAVQKAIWAGDQIDTKPYILGGGHGSFISPGYDCSGSVSYVLHAAGLLSTPEDSGQLESWGVKGLGQWITVYTNAGHAFVEIAGIRFDTSAEQDPDPAPGTGPRWRPLVTSSAGFVARHPLSY